MTENPIKPITIASCQHPVSADVSKNLAYIVRLAEDAKNKGAEIAHFSECNLSGYPGFDFQEFPPDSDRQIRQAMETVCRVAARLKIKLIVGTHWYTRGPDLPCNSLFLINEHGEAEARYDKRILAGAPGESDRRYYSAGKNPLLFELKGVRCGLLICHEWRYPELYREYAQLGVRLLFQSWYDGNLSRTDYLKAGKELGSLIMGTVRGNAANNYLWISGSNTSSKESSFPSFLVRPDGRLVNKLNRNRTGVLINQVPIHYEFEDPSHYGRTLFR